MSELSIRAATADEFATAIGWAAAEGWNPGLDDAPVFHGTDPAGFLLGWRAGEPVAAISVVRYNASFGFLGFYLVRPEQRGAGAGLAIWNAGIATLSGRVIGLDGVVAQQDNYRKSGFAPSGRHIRHSGVAACEAADLPGVLVRPVHPGDLDALDAFDRRFFPAPRSAFIRPWTAPPPGTRRTSLIALKDGAIAGYGTIRACREGFKIGPLFAHGEAIATLLAARLVAAVPALSTVTLDVPDANPPAIALAARLGLSPGFETARMYRGPAPRIDLDGVYGVTTFELG